jgi:hypothetical protein
MTVNIRFGLAVVLLVASASAAAGAKLKVLPLKVVNVSAPAIYCVFDTTCNVTDIHTTASFSIQGAIGLGFLQSRTFTGAAGSPGAGLTAYLYRIDLTETKGLIQGVLGLEVDFGPLTKLDYTPPKRGRGSLDHVFVITSADLGGIGLKSAYRVGKVIRFQFSEMIYVGQAGPGASGGASSFFGLAAATPPKEMLVKVLTLGTGPEFGSKELPVNVSTRVPTH